VSDFPDYVDRRAAAEHLKRRGLPVAFNTLQKMATTGGGPTYRVFGGRVVYTIEDLDRWAKERLSEPVRSSSERRRPARAA
jgi:hypothetical protein